MHQRLTHIPAKNLWWSIYQEEGGLFHQPLRFCLARLGAICPGWRSAWAIERLQVTLLEIHNDTAHLA